MLPTPTAATSTATAPATATATTTATRHPAPPACSQLDLDDLQGAVDNAAKDPAKFGIAPEELQRRRSFISQTRAEANSIRDTLAAAKSVKSARKERIERQGLLAGRGSSSCEMASGAVQVLAC